MAVVPRTRDIVIQTYNLFLNSDDGKLNGQNYDFQLGNNSINTHANGQYIRLTLINFNMYKNWTDVNSVNHGLVLRLSAGAVNLPVLIDDQNYANLRDLATNLSTGLLLAVQANATLVALFGATTISNILPLAGTGINGTSNNIIGFTLNTTNPHGFTQADITGGNFSLQSVIDPQNLTGGTPLGVAVGADSGLLCGIDRTPATTLASGFNIATSSPNTLVFLANYPAQRFTEPNVYIRVSPTPQVFASNMFNIPLDTIGDNPLNPTNILAEIRIDTEMIQYTPQAERQYFANMYQKQMNHLQVALTDSRNRALPLFGTNQATLGNRHFTATIRVDIMEDTAHGERPMATQASSENKNTLPARFDSNVLISTKSLTSGYGKKFGY